MNAPETVMSDYIKGFDAGCDYMLREIENFERVWPAYAKNIPALLAHLKMENKRAEGE
jgi:hypothetical protein